MSSEVKINANRANAQKSTGPRTVEGKEKSKQNTVRHGLTGKMLIAPGENAADYDSLLEGMMASYSPANAAESALVEEVAQCFWRLQRARRIESELFNCLTGGADPVITFTGHDSKFDNIRRYMTSIERSYHRAMEALAAMQKERRKNDPPDGFVSQSSKGVKKQPVTKIVPIRRPDRQDTQAPANDPRPLKFIPTGTDL